MKYIKCDRCGKMENARQASGWAREMIDDGGYVFDLCADCSREFNELLEQLRKEREQKLKEFVEVRNDTDKTD